MDSASRKALTQSFSDIATEIDQLPPDAFDWKSSDDEWSCREIVAHVSHANDFYVMICEEAVQSEFGLVELTRQLPGYALMVQTNGAVLSVSSIDEANSLFEERFQRLITVLDELSVEKLARPFTLSLDWSNEPAHSTTLRRRVIDVAREHMIEHRAQLADTVAKWRYSGEISS